MKCATFIIGNYLHWLDGKKRDTNYFRETERE